MKKIIIISGLSLILIVVLLFTIGFNFVGSTTDTAAVSNIRESIKGSRKSVFTELVKDKVFLAPNDGSLTIPVFDPSSGKGDPTQQPVEAVLLVPACKAFYQYYPDKFDFLVVLTTIDSGFDSNFSVRNSVKGIGRAIDDESNYCGTKKLLSIVTFGSLNNYALGELGDLLHEVSHQWLMYIVDTNLKIGDGTGAHWSQFIDTATRKDGFIYFSPNRGNPFIDNGDGTFSLDNFTPMPLTSYRKFNSMELYLMGFIPSTKVTPLTLWQTESTQLAQTMIGTKKMITVQDIINIAGPRIPAYPKTQRDFKIAYIIIPKKGEVTSSLTIEKVKQINAKFPKEWSFATNGLSIIK